MNLGYPLEIAALLLLILYARRARSMLSTMLLVAFFLRAGVGVADDLFPGALPEKYYSDSARYHAKAMEIARAWRNGETPRVTDSFGHLNYEYVVAVLYFLFGAAPMIPKCLNALLAALALVPAHRIARALGGEKGANAAIVLLALWPSAVFFSSLNFRDPLINFFFAWHVAVTLSCLSAPTVKGVFLSALLALVSSVFRPEMLVLAGISWILLAGALVLKHWKWSLGFSSLALILCVLAWWISPNLPFYKALQNPAATTKREKQSLPVMLTEHRQHLVRTTGDGESGFLREVEFRTWGDLAIFFPQGMFHVAFMPLPGLYPTQGKLVRVFASIENLLFFALSLGALGSFLRNASRRGVGGRAWYLLLYLGGIVGVLAVIEPDLGTVMRHKVLLFPLFFALVGMSLFPSTRAVTQAPPRAPELAEAPPSEVPAPAEELLAEPLQRKLA